MRFFISPNWISFLGHVLREKGVMPWPGLLLPGRPCPAASPPILSDQITFRKPAWTSSAHGSTHRQPPAFSLGQGSKETERVYLPSDKPLTSQGTRF